MNPFPTSRYKIDELCSVELDNKFLQITLHNGLFNVETVERILNKIDAFLDGKELLTIINCEDAAKTTFKALKRMSEPSAMQYATAKAYVITTTHQKAMADLFLTFFKPSRPVKFFRDLKEAKEWLGQLQ